VGDFEFLVVEGKFNKSVSNMIKHVVGPELWKSYTFYGIEKEKMAAFNALDLCQCIKSMYVNDYIQTSYLTNFITFKITDAIRRRFPLEIENTFNRRAVEVFT
jgi:hypothetical protein